MESYNTGDPTSSIFAVIDPDGTRHEIQYVGPAQSGSPWALFEATDGSFIRTYIFNDQLASEKIAVYYSDGSKSIFGAPDENGTRYATKLIDKNGNYLEITYLHGGKVSSVKDTLNREILFHYDDNENPSCKLVAITVPGINNGTRRQVVRFYYQSLELAPRFSSDAFVNGAVVTTGQSTNFPSINVLRYIYFPGTKTGYRYDYSPDDSAWNGKTMFGMIWRMRELHGMTVSDPGDLTSTGTVSSDGETANTISYNYPKVATDLSNNVPLNDVPKYTERTDDWKGRPTGNAPKYTFWSSDRSAEVCSEVTDERVTLNTTPDGTTSETVSVVNENGWNNGLPCQVRIITGEGSNTRVWSKTRYFWQQGPTIGGRDNPQIGKIEITNDVNLTRATTFSYDDFNNQTVVSEHDFSAPGTVGTELRRTETTYETGAGWLQVNLIRLPKLIITKSGGVTVSRTEIEYDKNVSPQTDPPPTLNRSDVENHAPEYSPYLTHNVVVCGPSGCVTVVVFYAESYFHGDVTKVVKYADASKEQETDDPKALKTTGAFDITGNEISAGVSCCNLKEWTYTNDNNYAYPLSERSGDEGQFTRSSTYDLNTGLVLTTTNENDQVTHYEYETDTLRPKKTTFPNDGTIETFYSDKELSVPSDMVPSYVRTKTKLETDKFAENYSYLDSRGLGIRTASQTTDGWLIEARSYDDLGRLRKTYNPFYGSSRTESIPLDQKYTEITGIDALGRTTKATLQDETTVDSFPNESTISYTAPNSQSITGISSRVVDQAGKERRQIVDALGRIVRVDEPNTSGALGDVDSPNQPTFYEYDGNDNLSKVIQRDNSTSPAVTQARRFRYDSLSRLVAEYQVEADATLLIDGTKGTVDNENKWSKVLVYNEKGLLTDGFDARGVHTQMSYNDPLNRLKSITYSGESGFKTPAVTYTYDQSRTGYYNSGVLTKVETSQGDATLNPDAPSTKTEFDYDLMGRVKKHRQWIGDQEYDLEYGYNLVGQLTSEKYPSGRIVTNTFDANGRFSAVADGSRTYLSGLEYEGKGGSLSQMAYGNGTVQTFDLNYRMQMSSQELKKGTETVQKYVYGFGQIDENGDLDASKNNGQLGQIEGYIGTSKQWTQKFSYDAGGRLGQAAEYKGTDDSLTYQQTFDFDRFGNMYRKSTHNGPSGQANPLPYTAIEDSDISKATNRFTSSTTYDEAGQVTADTKFRGMGFGYDANGRMVKATKTDVPNALSVYDAAGMRVAEYVNDVWRFSIYDIGGKLVSEYGGQQSTDEGGVKYLLSDWQGSNRAVLSNTGNVLARADYTAFGEDIQSGVGLRTTAQGFDSRLNPRQKYGVTERDEATGLDHTWFRKHENRAGRWTGPDPYGGSESVSNPQSFNRYSYVLGQPINFIDPSGLNLQIIGEYCEWWAWFEVNPDGSTGKQISAPFKVCYPIIGNFNAGPSFPIDSPIDSTSSTTINSQIQKRPLEETADEKLRRDCYDQKKAAIDKERENAFSQENVSKRIGRGILFGVVRGAVVGGVVGAGGGLLIGGVGGVPGAAAGIVVGGALGGANSAITAPLMEVVGYRGLYYPIKYQTDLARAKYECDHMIWV